MPASVELSPMFDPTLERVGFPLDHPYIERVYCSVLGPELGAAAAPGRRAVRRAPRGRPGRPRRPVPLPRARRARRRRRHRPQRPAAPHDGPPRPVPDGRLARRRPPRHPPQAAGPRAAPGRPAARARPGRPPPAAHRPPRRPRRPRRGPGRSSPPARRPADGPGRRPERRVAGRRPPARLRHQRPSTRGSSPDDRDPHPSATPPRALSALTFSTAATREPLTFSTPPTRSRTAQPADTHLQVSLRETCAAAFRGRSLPAPPQLSAHQSSRPRPWSSSRSRETSPTRCTVSIDCTATAHSRYWTPSVGESCRRSGSTPHSSR